MSKSFGILSKRELNLKIELTPNSGSAEITEPLLNVKPTSDHDDRYEKFEAFIKEQRDSNKKIENHISSNSIGLSECTIELKDLEQKCKNQAKEVTLSCKNHIQAVKDEIGEQVQNCKANCKSILQTVFGSKNTEN